MTGSWQEEEKAEKAMEAETGWCYKSKNTGGRQKGEESRKHPGAFRGSISLLTTWFPMSTLQHLWRKCAISCQDHNNLLWEPQEANTVDLNHHYPCTERKYVASTHPYVTPRCTEPPMCLHSGASRNLYLRVYFLLAGCLDWTPAHHPLNVWLWANNIFTSQFFICNMRVNTIPCSKSQCED